MNNISLSTGYKELDEILEKNNIIDQETQANERFKRFVEAIKKSTESQRPSEAGKFDTHRFPIHKEDSSNKECLIQKAIQREIDEGIPEYRRTKVWCISCPCRRCSPHSFK